MLSHSEDYYAYKWTEDRDEIILDFSQCRCFSELHHVLKEGFGFPDYYGENLDALWDCLDGYCDNEMTVTIMGVSALPKEFMSYMERILEVFEDVHRSTPNITFEVVS